MSEYATRFGLASEARIFWGCGHDVARAFGETWKLVAEARIFWNVRYRCGLCRRSRWLDNWIRARRVRDHWVVREGNAHLQREAEEGREGERTGEP